MAEAEPGGVGETVSLLVDDRAALLSSDVKEDLTDSVLRELTGFGPLEEVMSDPRVEEVMVVGHEEVFVERGGAIEATGIRFRDEDHLRNTIERILAPLGRRVDESSPMADARLPEPARPSGARGDLACRAPGSTDPDRDQGYP
ncbi:MAG: ATPase, T2SS/T4P/T4SS family, partial [Solirubrobacterales bacterium]